MLIALEIGYRHREWWALTPAEFGEVMEGYRTRQEREWQRWAWAVAHLLNVSGRSLKRRITPDKLLGRVKAHGTISSRPQPKESEPE